MSNWYRVELNYEGAVVSCMQVCGREFGGRYIYFVSASSQDEAVEKVADKWQQWRERRLARLENGGLCTMCGKRPRVDGRVKCEHCLTLQSENKRDLALIRKDPDAEALLAARAATIAGERRDSLVKATRDAQVVRIKTADARWAAGELRDDERSAVRRILRIYFLEEENFPERMVQLLGYEQETAQRLCSDLIRGILDVPGFDIEEQLADITMGVPRAKAASK